MGRRVEDSNFRALTSTNALCFYIIYLMLYVKRNQTGVVAQVLSLQRPRPGFESQVCIMLHVIFQLKLLCSASVETYHMPSWSKHTRVPDDHTKGIDPRSTMYHSQTHHMLHKKVNGFQAIGPDLLDQHLTNWGYPPWFAFTIFFIYFLFLF